jgi:hypothetical protein
LILLEASNQIKSNYLSRCKGREISFSIEFVYKEGSSESIIAKGKKKKKSAIEAQKL